MNSGGRKPDTSRPAAPRTTPAARSRRTLSLEPYVGSWPDDDPDAGFRALVAEYSRFDPLSTLETLSRNKGIPLGALVSFILYRYSASGSDALLEMGPSVVRQMDDIIRRAEAVDTVEARLEAYGSLSAIVSWLKVPLDDPEWRPGPSRYLSL